jgi:Prealbumin-like fold domain
VRERRRRTALLAAGALVAGLFAPVALAAPAYAAPNCDLGGFEIDGDTPVNCPPGEDDWASVDYATTDQGGTYSSSSKDVNNPSGWVAAGSTPDKADFATVYTYAQVGDDGHYYLYVAWDRTGASGTGKYAIELSFDGINVVPTGNNNLPTPQPIRDNGGVVAYITMNGGNAPLLGQLCPYEDQVGYPDNVNSDPGDCTTDTTGFASAIGASGTFFEVGFDLTELADIVPDCPPATSEATVYMRSITGGSGDGNLKAFVSPLSVTPPSTCGYLDITKESLNDLAVDDTTVFDYDVTAPGVDTISGDLQIGDTDSYFEVDPGDEYSLDETIPTDAPWSISSIVCTLGEDEYVIYENGDYTGVEFPVATAETTECVITNATSFVTVEKQTLPDGSSQDFDFTITDGQTFDLSDGQTQTFQFAPGTDVEIIEDALDGWDLTGVECTVDEAAIELGVGVTTVAGQTVTCVFTNTQAGTIIIHKVVDGVSDGTFQFTSETLGDFPITTDQGVGSEDFLNLVPGTYDVAESPITGFDTTNLVCVDGSGGTTVDLANYSAAIDLAPGETVECTFTNTERGKILVDKETEPDEFDKDFEFVFAGGGQPDQEFTLNDSTDDEGDPWSSGLITPGSYSVEEFVPSNWTLDDIDCGTREGDLTTVTLAAGEIVTCVFTNVAEPGSVSLTKSVDGVDESYPWSFDFTLTEQPAGAPVTKTVDNSALPGSATAVWGDLTVGETYTLIEDELPFGWSADDIVCDGVDDGDEELDGFQFTVTPGLELDCTALNTATPAEVELTKTVSGFGDGAWSFDFTIAAGDSDGETRTATNESPVIGWDGLVPGVEYTIIESATPGWVNGDIECSALEQSVVDLDPATDGFQFLATPGLVLECEADNEALPGGVTVKKSTVGGEGTFGFVLTQSGFDGDPRVREITTVDGGGQAVFDLVDPGHRYSIEETTSPDGWEKGPMTCDVTPAGGDTVSINAADFELAPGDEVVCAITNTLRPPMPVTGVNLAAGITIALLLLGGGAALFLIRRRSRRAE